MPQAFDRIFEGAQRIAVEPPPILPMAAVREMRLAGNTSAARQLDNMANYGRLTADAADPVALRFYDSLVEHEPVLDQYINPFKNALQFPAALEGDAEAFATGRFRYPFHEVRWKASTETWPAKLNGRTSHSGSNALAYPAYSGVEHAALPTVVTALPPGTVVLMNEVIIAQQRHYWFEGYLGSAQPDVILGQVTEVHGGPYNCTYSVIGQHYPSIVVTNAIPINRTHNPDNFDWAPAVVGADCEIYIRSFNNYNIVVWEQLLDEACPNP